MPSSAVLSAQPLGFQWPTLDPFLFCVYHDDRYPRGNAQLGPAASLDGRNLGQDFEGKDGWRMYHGMAVPGFPSHPHRGFETVTIVREGLIDHSDSLGATARFGGGDVQWLTAGKGIVHAEMFPLLDPAKPNRLELFQIWLNLPASHKMVEPHFTMFWSEQIPRHRVIDSAGLPTDITCIAGVLRDSPARPLAPPPDSWAAREGSELAIWTLRMAPGARWTLPAAMGSETRRMLYFFQGDSIAVDGATLGDHAALELRGGQDVALHNGAQEAELVVLQGRPIAETVARYGPFVMNTQAEIQQAFADYRRTEFGGWPWPDNAPVHGKEIRRFASHADGKTETLPMQTRSPVSIEPTQERPLNFVFPPAPPVSVPVTGRAEVFAVHRIYCVGRNYEEHAKEMGFTGREPPFFFMKPADAVVVVPAGGAATIDYPPLTSNLHPEIELVIAIGRGGRNIAAADALQHVFGYAVGLDMTRRDLQNDMKKQGRPWCIGKAFDQSAPIGPITPAAQAGDIAQAGIFLQVNGQDRQRSAVSKLIWNISETIEHLSAAWELQAGDLIFSGTPEGVAAVVRGDTLTGGVAGLEPIRVSVR